LEHECRVEKKTTKRKNHGKSLYRYDPSLGPCGGGENENRPWGRYTTKKVLEPFKLPRSRPGD